MVISLGNQLVTKVFQEPLATVHLISIQKGFILEKVE